MARPKKEFHSRKSVQVNVRMTIQDYCNVSKNAKTVGLSITDYIRKICAGKPLPKKKLSPLDRELFVQLSRIGNNINQLTKIYNSGIRDPLGIKEQLIMIKGLLTLLKSNISNNDR